MDKVHFSTGKDDWGTPQDLFDALNKEFNFTLDPCADDNNHKCAKYYTIEQDGLAQSWAGETVFCNPPYSRKTKTNAGQIAWVQKCYKEATEGGIVVVMLIPARTDTIMFHDYILGKAEIRFIKGRVNFEVDGQKSKDPAPFPSMIVVDLKIMTSRKIKRCNTTGSTKGTGKRCKTKNSRDFRGLRVNLSLIFLQKRRTFTHERRIKENA